MSITKWETLHSKFRHDWLKNEYVNELKTIVYCVDSENYQIKYYSNFINKTFWHWEMKIKEGQKLTIEFENEMSRSKLCLKLPLSNFDNDSLEWLKVLTHETWLFSNNVKEWIDQSVNIFNLADEQHNDLKNKLSAIESENIEQISTCSQLLRIHLATCIELSNFIRIYPKRF